MIKHMMRWLGVIGLGVVFLGGGLFAWANWRLSHDDPAIERLEFASFEMGKGVPDGSAPPAPDGYRVDSAGRGHILPPLPAERAMDVHTARNQQSDFALRSCFWPRPRARSGVFTNDTASVALENQLPDTATTYIPVAFKLPEGAELVIKGEFPFMRHWNLNTYDSRGEPLDALSDIEIEPDAGSLNPFRAGVARTTEARRYTIRVVSGAPPEQRPANTLYTYAPAGRQSYVWMRNYVPDGSIDYLGGVGLPEVELQLANGDILTGEAACRATDAPMRGRQLPTSVDPRAWVLLTHLPWVDSDNIGATREPVRPLQAFFNRPQVMADLFAPWLSSRTPKVAGGWWSNRATRYGYLYLSRNYGAVYVVTARMPVTPRTWAGATENTPNADMGYMSLCTTGAPAAGTTVDCLYDEQIAQSVDESGRFAVVISQGRDRPTNATAKCGVQWMEFGNGDGFPSGSPNFAALINRHTQVRGDFQHSWFGVDRPGEERAAMGDYLPHVLNLGDKQRFEALGCPVDRRALYERLPAN